MVAKEDLDVNQIFGPSSELLGPVFCGHKRTRVQSSVSWGVLSGKTKGCIPVAQLGSLGSVLNERNKGG